MKFQTIILLIFLGYANVTIAQNDHQNDASNTQQNSLGFTMTPVHGMTSIRSTSPARSSQGFTINLPRRNQNGTATNTNRQGGFQSSSTRQVTENGARQMGGQMGGARQMGGQMGGQVNGARQMGGQMGGARQMGGVARR